MVSKKYLCVFSGNTSYTLKDGTNVMFEDRGAGHKGGFYVTMSESEQRQIENLFAFKIGQIFLDPDCKAKLTASTAKMESKAVNEPIPTQEPKIKEYKDVVVVQVACDVIKKICEERNVHYKKPRTKAEVRTLAETLCISFPNL